MYAENVRTMERHLARLVEGGDFDDIAMCHDVRFTGPMTSATGAAAYRSMCQDLADTVRAISVRTMVGDDRVLHVVYDVDSGLATGPLPTSQTAQFVDGAFASVDVIFDSAVVTTDAS